MKTLVLGLLLLSITGFTAGKKWNKHYALVNKDIKSIEKLPRRDLELNIRLFELYGEKLGLLLEVENDLRMHYLEKGTGKAKLDQSLRLQKGTLSKIQSVSKIILNSTRDKELIGKIHYYKALSYLFVKEYRNYEISLLKAERNTKDPKLLQSIRVKLGDHYYNEKRFKQAAKRYRLAAKDKRDRWRSKTTYNLAWCEFKLGLTDTALKRILFAYRLSNSKYYFTIGDQLTDSILIFYANSGRTQEGLSFLKSKGLYNSDMLLRYAHHVFELGEKQDVIMVFSEIEKLNANIDQRAMTLAKQVEIYRNLKRFPLIQNALEKFKNQYILDKGKTRIKKLNMDSLVTSVLGYNGFLQELIKSKNYGKKQIRNTYAKYIYNNLDTLKKVDPVNKARYTYYQGETYMELGNHKAATKIYVNAINAANINPKAAGQYLTKIFDSAFKSMEISNESRPKVLTFVFESYLKHFPAGPKSDSIHMRLIELAMKSKNKRGVLNKLVRYNKFYPEKIKIQKDYYKSLLNFFIDAKDTVSLEKLRKALEGGFLSFKANEIAVVSKAIEGLRFDKFEQMAKDGKVKEAIAGFNLIYLDKKNHKNLRINALRRKQYYQNQLKDHKALSQSISQSFDLYSLSDRKKWGSELNFYLTNICLQVFTSLRTSDSNCVELKGYWDKYRLPYPKQLTELYFRKLVSLSDYGRAFKMAFGNPTRQDFFLQGLLLEYPNFDHSIYEKLYPLAGMKQRINPLVLLRFWRKWNSTLSTDKLMDFAKDIEITMLSKTYQQMIRELERQIGAKDFRLPEVPSKEKEVDFDTFSAYLEKLISATSDSFGRLENGFMKVNPNFVPYLVKEKIKQVKEQITIIESYEPNTKDDGLSQAIKNEMRNIASVYEQKIKSYENFYNESLSKTLQGVGSDTYRHGMRVPAYAPYSNEAIWEGY